LDERICLVGMATTPGGISSGRNCELMHTE
jgi:hypothetical protein